eukprot:COSAG05_NODE_16691_length_340_cov_2.294606_1_plen_30_part_01
MVHRSKLSDVQVPYNLSTRDTKTGRLHELN